MQQTYYDDTYYWVYLSWDHLFQVYYKVRQVLLQSATAFFKLQSAIFCYYKVRQLFITKCDQYYFKVQRYYKMWQFYYKVRRLLQSATVPLHDYLLDIALAKCQRATIQNKWILRHTVMFCARPFFVVKYSRQLEMS